MDTLEKYGIKVPNSVLIKYVTNTETDDEVVEFLSRYGKVSKFDTITEPGVFKNTLIVEFASGEAMVELRNILPYTYVCETEKVTYDLLELSRVCSEFEGRLKTQKYLGELENLAKLTGQDYTEVLQGVMSLLGQSITGLSSPLPVKLTTEAKEEVVLPTVTTSTLSNPATASPSQVTATTVPKSQEELPKMQPNPSAQFTLGYSAPTMTLPDLNPPGIQRYVVEHIVKSDDSAAHMSTQRLRSFSGRTPRPPHESDYDTWRTGVDLLLKDPAVSDLQRSRKILDSLLPPAADMVRHLPSETPPQSYLQILDSAYGTVQDGDELYAKFMDLFQNAGEQPSAYLQRLQVALNMAMKRGGVKATELDRHLLNQFCRGCWDNTLISELQLKQRKSHPPSFAELLLLLRTEEDREAAKTQRMKQHLGSKARAGAHAQYVCATAEESKVDALTTITQQLSQQLAEIQKQLASLTAAQSGSRQPFPSKFSPVSSRTESLRTSKAPTRSSYKAPATGPKPGYCYNCGEDGHIKPNCENDPNPSLVATKKKQFSEKQRKWQKSVSDPSPKN